MLYPFIIAKKIYKICLIIAKIHPKILQDHVKKQPFCHSSVAFRKCNLATNHREQLIVFDCDVVSLTVITMERLWSSHHDPENLIFMDFWT